MQEIKRIAMWSGPRNISTAMMYSFAARSDCLAWDEPFYAFYLAHAGITHPMHQDVIDAGETSWDKVVDLCIGQDLAGAKVHYQKHMTHHMLAGFGRTWMTEISNAFLIRSPEHVLASYAKKRDEVSLRDIGFKEQAEIFDRICDHLGAAPPVVDADDILSNPHQVLSLLCEKIGIRFEDQMLSWQTGPKPYDGSWAPHWYNAVWQTTGFGHPPSHHPALEDQHRHIAAQAQPFYEKLHMHRLKATA